MGGWSIPRSASSAMPAYRSLPTRMLMALRSEVAASIGAGLAKAALAGRVDGRLVDTSFRIERDASVSIVTDKDADGIEIGSRGLDRRRPGQGRASRARGWAAGRYLVPHRARCQRIDRYRQGC